MVLHHGLKLGAKMESPTMCWLEQDMPEWFVSAFSYPLEIKMEDGWEKEYVCVCQAYRVFHNKCSSTVIILIILFLSNMDFCCIKLIILLQRYCLVKHFYTKTYNKFVWPRKRFHTEISSFWHSLKQEFTVVCKWLPALWSSGIYSMNERHTLHALRFSWIFIVHRKYEIITQVWFKYLQKTHASRTFQRSADMWHCYILSIETPMCLSLMV